MSFLDPPKRYNVIIAGGFDAARDAVAKVSDRSMQHASLNGYGAVHATIWAHQDDLIAWFSAEHNFKAPGTLLWYSSDE